MAQDGKAGTLMQNSWLTVLALFLLGCQNKPAQTLTTQAIVNLKRIETVIYAPTGPTRRIEFKHASTGELVRLEIQHLTTGRRILGETAARLDEAGFWLLYNLSDNKIIARFIPATTQVNEACQSMHVPQGKSVLAADFVNAGAKWRANITRIYEQPKPMPGIATESEAAVDIIACKLKN